MMLDSSENDFKPAKRYRKQFPRPAMVPTFNRPWLAPGLNKENKRNFMKLHKLYLVYQEVKQVKLDDLTDPYTLFVKLSRKQLNFTPTKAMYFYLVDHGDPLEDKLYQEFLDKQINSKG